MTKTARRISDTRTRELAAIHVAKKDLGLSDDEYRDILFVVARVRSASDLDAAGRARVLDHFRSRGALGGRQVKRNDSDPMVRKLWALWGELVDAGKANNPNGLNAWVQRQTGVSRPQWLNGRQMEKCIEALKKWLDR